MQSLAQAEYEHRANSSNSSASADRTLPAAAWSSPSRRLGAASHTLVQRTPSTTASRVARALFDDQTSPLSRPGISTTPVHSPPPAPMTTALPTTTHTPPQSVAVALPASRPGLYLSDQERRERRQVFVNALNAHTGSTWAEATLPVSQRRQQRDRGYNHVLMQVRVHCGFRCVDHALLLVHGIPDDYS
jgi:hypothetical protein